MNISKKISDDILKYLQNKKGMSIKDIAEAMSSTPDHIQKVIDQKELLTSDHINQYLNNKNVRFWELALEAIPKDHLTPKVAHKIKVCKDIYDHINRNKKKY